MLHISRWQGGLLDHGGRRLGAQARLDQARLWSGAFALQILTTLACAVLLWRRAAEQQPTNPEDVGAADGARRRDRLLWLLLPSRLPQTHVVAIATATMLFGLSSGAALATVVGVLIEVPFWAFFNLCPMYVDRFVATDQLYTAFSSILGALTLALAAIAAVSLTVAGVGIMNVVLVSVSERTAEIGLMKALGARSRQILAVFLAEAAGGGHTVRDPTTGEPRPSRAGDVMVLTRRLTKVRFLEEAFEAPVSVDIEQGKGQKIIVFKYKRRKRYRRKQGHRQTFTAVKIDSIQAN